MNKIKSTIKFLFNQNKIVIGLAFAIAQFHTAIDIDWAINSMSIPLSRAVPILFVFELIALIIIFPILLFAFKVTGRMKQIIGAIPAGIVFVVSILIEEYLTRQLHAEHPGAETLVFILTAFLFTLTLSLMMLIVKGKSTFFEVRMAETSISKKVDKLSEVLHKVVRFCDQCGNPVAESSKFCSKCGNQILAAQAKL